MGHRDDTGQQPGSIEDVVPRAVVGETAVRDPALRLVPASPLYRGAHGSAPGGSVGGLGVGAVGLPRVFLVPAACALVAVVGLFLLDRSCRKSRASSPAPVGPA
jgi:hypothetical protein